MIQIKNLTLTAKKDLRVLIDNLNLNLNKGDKAAIIGEEGNGKSTLLKTIFNSNLVKDYIEIEGTCSLINETVSYLAQELDEATLNKTIYEFFSEDFFYDSTYDEQVSLARKFNLPLDIYYSNQVIKTLSGGEKIKLQLIKILLEKTSCLLLDEPSNDLDLETLAILENLINEFSGIILFISHDEVLLTRTANVIIHIEQLRRKTVAKVSVSRTSYDTYIKTRLNAINKQEQLAVKDEKEKKIRDEKYARVYNSVNDALRNKGDGDVVSKNLKDKMHTVKAMAKRFEKQDQNLTLHPETEDAIKLKLDPKLSGIDPNKIILDLSLDELKMEDRVLIKDLKLFIKGNTHLAIIGTNGSGKSTLLKLIYNKLKTRSDLKVGYMPQNYQEKLDLTSNVVEYLASDSTKESLTKTRTFLGSLKFTTDEMNHTVADLSGGQKAKVLLLKLLLDEANVLILDEPTRNFSPLSNPIIRELLISYPGTIISVSHDRKYLEEVTTEIYELKDKTLTKIKSSNDF